MAHVVGVDVDVDESRQLTVGRQAIAQRREAGEQRVERLAHRGSGDLELPRPVHHVAEHGRDSNVDHRRFRAGHDTPSFVAQAANASSDGSIASPAGRLTMASSVFSPLPVMTATTSSSGPTTPRATAACSAATVTPPAVSVRIPSVSASSRIAAIVTASSTPSMLPPLVRASASDRWPSAGLPMASDRTMVSGLATGWIVSPPLPKAVATGAQPAGWPPMWRV